MAKSKEWFDANVEEIKKRLLTAYNIVGSYAIILRENGEEPEIDLVKHDQMYDYDIVKHKIIAYKELKSAKTVEERIELTLNAVRDYNFMFYIDGRLIKLILKE